MRNDAVSGTTDEMYHLLDEAPVSRFHWLIVFTAGMGFFTYAYDIFIIGTATTLLKPIFHLDTAQLAVLDSVLPLAAIAGALVFGKFMDVIGRKKMYGIEAMLLAVGAVLAAFSWDFTSLLVFLVVIGIGIGGDVPTSGVVTSEYSNRRHRGRLVGAVFAMQGFGLVAGSAVASVLIAAGVPNDMSWRLMLGFGAVPAVSVIYLRRKIRETPRFTFGVRGDVQTTAETVRWAVGEYPAFAAPLLEFHDGAGDGVDGSENDSMSGSESGSAVNVMSGSESGSESGNVAAYMRDGMGHSMGGGAAGSVNDSTVSSTASGPYGSIPAGVRAKLTSRPFLLRLIGTAGTWFLVDIAYYGNSASSPLILKTLQPHGTLLSHTLILLAIFAVAALPGFWTAVWLMDRIGRKRIQLQGFLVMTVTFAAIALIPGVTRDVWAFVALFAASYFFIEYGPNETTFVYGSEMFPATVRGMGDGISASMGKFGAFLGGLCVPPLLRVAGVSGVMGAMAIVSLAGAMLTVLALPEPKGQTLEQASADSGFTPDPTRHPSHLQPGGEGAW
ncbi:MAG: MFS transporter [Actinobacteria bacterium]|nr:MFS transporter [Actinomycetota bacterium]MCL5446621.1 MFS transporter [Actinomycetota bacterium]